MDVSHVKMWKNARFLSSDIFPLVAAWLMVIVVVMVTVVQLAAEVQITQTSSPGRFSLVDGNQIAAAPHATRSDRVLHTPLGLTAFSTRHSF